MTLVDAPARAPQRLAGRHRRIWLLVVVAALLGVGTSTGIWFAHWRSSLHELVGYPTYGSGGPYRVGETVYFGSNAWPVDPHGQLDGKASLRVHVSAAQPVVRLDTAGARIVVLKCVRTRPGDESLGGSIDDVLGYCAKLTTFAPGTEDIGESAGDNDLVLGVTMNHPGRVRIAGIEMRYSSGLRHGEQQVGGQIDIYTRR
jgi:hypothetical protein